MAKKIQDEFTKKLSQHISSHYGEGEQAKQGDLARIVNQRHTSRLLHLLEDAKSKGAQIIYGGVIDEAERFISPTLLTDIPSDAIIMQEEIFGPLLPIIPFNHLNEVIDQINAAPKPLALYIWSSDEDHIEKIIRSTSAGGTCINHNLAHALQSNLPFGGVNNSGIGSYRGEIGRAHV